MYTKKESPLLAGDMGFVIPQDHYIHNDDPRKEYGRKKFAPYSTPLRLLFATSKRPVQDVFLFVGKYAWRKASNFSKYRYTLLLPESHAPEDFHSPVPQCTVICVETSQQEVTLLQSLIDTLLSYGAVSICLIRYNYKTHFFGERYGQ